MIKHRHTISLITTRTVSGRKVLKASISEENGVFQAVVTDIFGGEYVSGSNARTLGNERAVLRGMLDAAR